MTEYTTRAQDHEPIGTQDLVDTPHQDTRDQDLRADGMRDDLSSNDMRDDVRGDDMRDDLRSDDLRSDDMRDNLSDDELRRDDMRGMPVDQMDTDEMRRDDLRGDGMAGSNGVVSDGMTGDSAAHGSGSYGGPAVSNSTAGRPNGMDQPDGGRLFDGDQAEHFRTRWTELQANFVDEPQTAVRQADELVAEVMRTLAATFAENKRELDGQWQREGEADTEDLRIALRRYRSFFDQLLRA